MHGNGHKYFTFFNRMLFIHLITMGFHCASKHLQSRRFRLYFVMMKRFILIQWMNKCVRELETERFGPKWHQCQCLYANHTDYWFIWSALRATHSLYYFIYSLQKIKSSFSCVNPIFITTSGLFTFRNFICFHDFIRKTKPY